MVRPPQLGNFSCSIKVGDPVYLSIVVRILFNNIFFCQRLYWQEKKKDTGQNRIPILLLSHYFTCPNNSSRKASTNVSAWISSILKYLAPIWTDN